MDFIKSSEIRALRAQRKIKLKEVYQATGISIQMLSCIERGTKGLCEESAKKLSKFYGVDIVATKDVRGLEEEHLKASLDSLIKQVKIIFNNLMNLKEEVDKWH